MSGDLSARLIPRDGEQRFTRTECHAGDQHLARGLVGVVREQCLILGLECFARSVTEAELGPQRELAAQFVDSEGHELRCGKNVGGLDDAPPGSGFGLAIVKDIATLYEGRLELSESEFGGLQATVKLSA